MSPPSSGGRSRARRQHEAGSKWHVPAERPLIFDGFHGVISQKKEVFMPTAVITSDPRYDYVK
jgi:hypothetical protein